MRIKRTRHVTPSRSTAAQTPSAFPPDVIVCAIDGSIEQRRPKCLTPLGTACAGLSFAFTERLTRSCTYEQRVLPSSPFYR